MRRTLTLRRETLAQLTSDELTAVAGAAVAATGGCPQSFYLRDCVATVVCPATGAA